MWQRIQTLFLSVAVIGMATMIFFPIWVGTNGSDRIAFYPLYLKNGDADIYYPYIWVAIFAIASVTVGSIEIGKYKNRLLQIKLGALNSLLMAATMVTGILFTRNLETTFAGAYSVSLFMPALGMVCNSIANRFIRRDEQLVKESDRLR